MTPEDRTLIKHAQKELIALCGGIDRAVAVAGMARSTVGRWADVGDPTIMPLPAVLRLQRACRTPVVTAALAAAENRILGDPLGEADAAQNVFTAMADTIVASGALNAAYGEALADGKLTPAELTAIDKALGALSRASSAARRAGAGARAAGGLAVVAASGGAA